MCRQTNMEQCSLLTSNIMKLGALKYCCAQLSDPTLCRVTKVTPVVDIIIDPIDSVPWIGNNATCAADPSCAAHSFSISKN